MTLSLILLVILLWCCSVVSLGAMLVLGKKIESVSIASLAYFVLSCPLVIALGVFIAPFWVFSEEAEKHIIWRRKQ